MLSGKFIIKRNSGFTLVELLVVISIIGFLASVAMYALNDARIEGRDAKRLTDLDTIQRALELYYDDHGEYPISTWVHSDEAGWQSSLGAALEPYLPTGLPIDPLNNRSYPDVGTGGWYQYVYSYYANSYGGAGQWYMMPIRLEKYDDRIANQDGAPDCWTDDPDHTPRGANDTGVFHYGYHGIAAYQNVITFGHGCTKERVPRP